MSHSRIRQIAHPLTGAASDYDPLLRRIGHITATAADIGSGALDRRLRDTGDADEVGQLATTFDAMADQLSDVMVTQRRLLSDVSHQLRTPLTVARGHLEVLARTRTADPIEVQDTVVQLRDAVSPVALPLFLNAQELLAVLHELQPLIRQLAG